MRSANQGRVEAASGSTPVNYRAEVESGSGGQEPGAPQMLPFVLAHQSVPHACLGPALFSEL